MATDRTHLHAASHNQSGIVSNKPSDVDEAVKRIEQNYMPVPESGCWLWMGAKSTGGYGRINVNGKRWQVHRFYYEQKRGDVPKELVMDHLCRVRCCINPDHLEPVTNKENILRGDGPAARNNRMTHCKEGHELAGDNLLNYSRDRRCKICSNVNLAKKYQVRCHPAKRRVNKIRRKFKEKPIVKEDRTQPVAWRWTSDIGRHYYSKLEMEGAEPLYLQPRLAALQSGEPVAYAIFGINGAGQSTVYDVKKIADDWKCDDGCLGEFWSGNEPLFHSLQPAQEVKVPDGWQLVPKEITWDMINAFEGAMDVWQNRYKDMIAAAPTPPLTQESKTSEDERVAMPKQFLHYMERNYPPHTVIVKPEWHAPKIWRAAMEALARNEPAKPESVKPPPPFKFAPQPPAAAVTHDTRLTAEQIRAVQMNTEIGAYIAANWANAYDCFNEFWRVASAALSAKGTIKPD